MTRRPFLLNSAQLAGGQIVLLASAAVVSLLAARWLGPTGKGELALAVAVGALLGPVAAGGVDTFIATRWRAVPADQRPSLRRFAVRVGWWGALAIGTATAAFGAANGLPAALIGAAVAAAALRPPLAVRQAIRISQDRVADLAPVAVVMAVAQIAMLVPFAVGHATPTNFAMAAAVSLAAGLLLLRRETPPEAAGVPTIGPRVVAPLDGAVRGDIRRFGGATALADGLQLANYRIDLFVLALFVPVPAIGIYSVAVMLAEVLWQVPNAVARSLLARLSAGDVDRRHVLSIALRLGGAIATLAAAGLLLTHLLAPRVLGQSYHEVSGTLAILLPGVVLLGAAKPVAAWTLSRGYPSRNLAASGLGFGITVTADLLLIPSMGIKGAALASTLSYLATTIAVVKLLPPGSGALPPAAPGTNRAPIPEAFPGGRGSSVPS